MFAEHGADFMDRRCIDPDDYRAVLKSAVLAKQSYL